MRLFLSLVVLALLLVVMVKPVLSFGNIQHFQVVEDNLQLSAHQFLVQKNDTGAWFYQIYSQKKLLIVQSNIPAIQGNIAFSDSTQAAKVAQLMCQKLQKGVFPPAISMHELDSLKIKY